MMGEDGLIHTVIQEFFEIGKSLSSEKDTMKLFEMIINSSMNLTSSDAGTVFIVVDKKTGQWSSIKNSSCENKLLKFVIAKNQSLQVSLETSLSPITRESIFGYTVITGNPVRIDDAYSLDSHYEYKHNRSYDKSTGYVTKSMLSIPMKDHENNILGVIQLINKKKNPNVSIDYKNPDALENILPYEYTDELIMNSLAGQAAVALENNLLYRDMNALLESYKLQNERLELLTRQILKAHEEERKRIAREIHDGPAQSVVNLSLKLELCKRFLQVANHTMLSSSLDDLNHYIKNTVQEIRTIIYDLKPSYLEEGLIRALENYLEVFTRNTEIPVNFTHTGSDECIEYYIVSAVYRMTQEALTNIVKHAKAKQVTIHLHLDEKQISLQIKDDGRGFDPSTVKSKSLSGGFGLEGMKERAALINGSVEIQSSPGKGTTVTLEIPL